jgi:DNA-binding MarR family transcriptional regulator
MEAPATAPTAWLTPAEQRAWRAYMRATRLLFGQLERELSRDAGMAPATYELLVLLSEAPRRSLRMNDLAEATLSSPSRITHAVERLVQLGWVERHSCVTDRRGWFATLTDAGVAALTAAAPRHVEHVRTHLFDALSTQDVEQLERISEKILTRLPGVSVAGGCGEE